MRNALLLEMSSKGYSVTHETRNSLSFSCELDPGAAALYQLTLGNAFSSHPVMNVTYTIVPQGNKTRVFAFAHVRMQGAFWPAPGMNMTRGAAGGDIHVFLLDVKHRVESTGRS